MTGKGQLLYQFRISYKEGVTGNENGESVLKLLRKFK